MTASVLAAALLAAGTGVLAWRPWRDLGGARPRLVIAVILSAAAAVWTGSLGLVVVALSGERAGLVLACEALWRKLVAGQLTWWQWGLAGLWVGTFPGRAMVTVAASTRRIRGVRGRLRGIACPLPGGKGPAVLVPGLATPAVTVGALRPQVLIDEAFWRRSSPHERSVVLAHEHAHRRGRHGVVELAAQALLCPLRPLAIARTACESLRAHLEALADDAASRTYGRESVGRTLGQAALSEAPAVGLGVTGSSVWRVQRLLFVDRRERVHALGVLVPALGLFVGGLTLTTAEVADLLLVAVRYCLI
ncbi:MAG: M56 family metallopeptidase [Actinomycetota bacterium]|nr:M56 family metallopeptidase [Actinomycetota bacterium]